MEMPLAGFWQVAFLIYHDVITNLKNNYEPKNYFYCSSLGSMCFEN